MYTDQNFRRKKEMIAAVEAVRERALRATKALRDAGIPYAVAGGNAVAAWVARVDRAAVGNTQDVDILLQRSDFDGVKQALESVGFVYRQVMGVDCFMDGPQGSSRDAVHLLYAGEKVRPDHAAPSTNISEVEHADADDVLTLAALVRMKLDSFRGPHAPSRSAGRGPDRRHLAIVAVPGTCGTTTKLIDDPQGSETRELHGHSCHKPLATC